MTQRALVLILLVLLSFGHSLGNGFVGDDWVKIVQTDYFSDFSNITSILSKEKYLVTEEQYARSNVTYSGSGELTYRPVVTVTYFIDRALWGLNPFGYHLANILIHIANILLLYRLLLMMLKEETTAFIAAALFAVHPLNAEIVNAISYRHGLLAAMFGLIALIAYLRHRERRGGRWLAICLGAYFLALLSNEYAFYVPALLIAYQFVFDRPNPRDGRVLILMGVVFAVFAYIYFILFPNIAVDVSRVDLQTFPAQLIVAGKIAGYYVRSFLLPWTVTLLPLNYAPAAGMPGTVMTYLPLLVLPAVLILPLILFRRNKVLFFGALWFVIALLPASNIIPIYNPIAHRRMYFPGIGMMIMMAWGLIAAARRLGGNDPQKVLRVLAILVLGVCMVTSARITSFWKNNLAYVTELIERYPWNTKAYFILGEENFRAGLDAAKVGNCKEAIFFLESAQRLGVQDERISPAIAACR